MQKELARSDNLVITAHNGWISVTEAEKPGQELIIHEKTWLEALHNYMRVSSDSNRLAGIEHIQWVIHHNVEALIEHFGLTARPDY